MDTRLEPAFKGEKMKLVSMCGTDPLYVRANLLNENQKLSHYPWSSYREYLKKPNKRPRWLRVSRLLGEMSIPKDSPAGRKEFEKQTELRRWEDQPGMWKQLRRGWCLGDKTFRKELLEQMGERAGESHYGDELRESDEQKAERIVATELRKLKWHEDELAQRRRKGDSGKVAIAKRLRKETTMTLKWIAQRLNMGTWTHVSNLLSKARK